MISRPTTASRVSLSRKARTSASAKLTGIRPSIPDIRLLAEIRRQLSDPTHAVADEQLIAETVTSAHRIIHQEPAPLCIYTRSGTSP